MAKRKWIQSATANAHGQFREKAERAGESTRQYADEHKSDGGKTGKQARLALALMGMHKKAPKKKAPTSAKGMREKMYGKEKDNG